ncbi:MAG TPA: SDR family oxidoreductase [Ilumatobacter sp.]|nr:SDR family oxidoreductase [Ilumatobacter sp.]
MDARPLAGQWSLVTGASKGIGYGIAEKLVDAGSHLALVARDLDALTEAETKLREIAQPDQQLVVRTADISDRGSIGELFAWVRAELGELNVLVANAGSGSVVPFLELTAEQWDATFALNLTGTFHCLQEAARIMVTMPEGSNRSIIAVSSIRGLGIRPGLAAYGASKSGLNQLVRTAAYELAQYGIRVNALSPGVTLTPLVAQNPDVLAERIVDIPFGRPGTIEDMGEAALFLANPASRFMTGTNTVVDGGESLY